MLLCILNRIGGVMVSVLATSAVNRRFETRSGKTKYYEICMCGFSNRIGGVMVSVLAASAVNRGFETRSGETKDYEICICGFSTKPAALRRKSKDWLTRHQDNVSDWGDMFIRGLLFQ
jgi:hypothetical protein